jgi:hypothetical protein
LISDTDSDITKGDVGLLQMPYKFRNASGTFVKYCYAALIVLLEYAQHPRAM